MEIDFSNYTIQKPSLRKMPARVRQPEIMDQPELQDSLHREALDVLRLANSLSLTTRTLWRPIRKIAATIKDRPIRILDVACGGGDVACRLALTAKKRGIPAEVHGADISETALQHSRDVAKPYGVAVEFFQLDLVNDAMPDDFDVIVNTLFMHHLDEDDIVTLLAKMSAATRQLVLVNDILRSRFGYFLAYYVPRLISRSPVVHIDGPISIQAAFTVEEFRALSDRAGLTQAAFSNRWPERFLMEWRKP